MNMIFKASVVCVQPCLLMPQDMIRFGNSTREYVLLHEGSNM